MMFRIIVITVEVDPLTSVELTYQTQFDNLNDAEQYYNVETKKDNQFRSTSIKLIKIIETPF